MKTNEKLGEILQLCLQLQASGWGDVNCHVSGHVKKVDVRGFKGGHSDTNTEPTFSKYCWYDADFDFISGNHETKIDDMISLLKSYIND